MPGDRALPCGTSELKDEGTQHPSGQHPHLREGPATSSRSAPHPHSLRFFSPPCFHDQKKYFFTFSVFFFFKVITEQVVVDANLPSVSKESVVWVRAGAIVGVG